MVLCVTAQNDAWHHQAPFLFPSPLHLSHQPHNNWALARCPGAFTVVPDASNIDKRNESRRRVGITQLENALPPFFCAGRRYGRGNDTSRLDNGYSVQLLVEWRGGVRARWTVASCRGQCRPV
jgi:hypothetical protein